MKIFLDDYRTPTDCVQYMYKRIGKLNPIYLEDWVIAKNYDQFVKVVSENIDKITHISFDHDLADEHYDPNVYENGNEIDYETYTEKTGYECAKWLKDFYKSNNKRLPIMFVHSMNGVGTNNIINLFKK